MTPSVHVHVRRLIQEAQHRSAAPRIRRRVVLLAVPRLPFRRTRRAPSESDTNDVDIRASARSDGGERSIDMLSNRAAAAMAFLLLGACGNDDLPAKPPAEAAPPACPQGEAQLDTGECLHVGIPEGPCDPGETQVEGVEGVEGGGCRPAGLPEGPCAPGEEPLATGGCEPAGVPPDTCGTGFQPDGERGCVAVLPAAPCAEGLMAAPGESACREVSPCGAGDYGDIPTDATTQHVKAGYAGGDSDGSPDKPWPTIQQGVTAAAPGAIVAVAAGIYAEDVLIKKKPVRLWGRCAGLVEIQAVSFAAVNVYSDADGAEIRDLAVTGVNMGAYISGSKGVLLERLWIHNNAGRGLGVSDYFGETSATIRGLLIEGAREMGAGVFSSDLTIEETVVRSTEIPAGLTEGFGVYVHGEAAAPASVHISSSVIEQNEHVGIGVNSAKAFVTTTVVRDTLPRATDQLFGHGILVGGEATGPLLTLEKSVLERNRTSGLWVTGAEVVVDATTVRDTLPRMADKEHGEGISLAPNKATGDGASLVIRRSTLVGNTKAGIAADGSAATVEATIARGAPSGGGDPSIQGVLGVRSEVSGQRSALSLRWSLVENNRSFNVLAFDSDVSIEGSIIRGSSPQGSNNGIGAGVAILNEKEEERPSLTLRSSIVEKNASRGVVLIGADGTIEDVIVRGTHGSVGSSYGRAVEVYVSPLTGERSSATIRGALIEDNKDIGVFNAGSDVTIEGSVVRDTMQVDTELGASGIRAQLDTDLGSRASLVVRRSVVERNQGIGVSVGGSDAILEETLIREQQPTPEYTSTFGLAVALDLESGERSNVMVRSSAILNNAVLGVIVVGSDVVLETTAIEGTSEAPGGGFGDGLGVFHYEGVSTSCTVNASRIKENNRAGIANFGATVKLGRSSFECNPIHLDGEPFGAAFAFEDSGGNRCECAGTSAPCKVLSADLEPPAYSQTW